MIGRFIVPNTKSYHWARSWATWSQSMQTLLQVTFITPILIKLQSAMRMIRKFHHQYSVLISKLKLNCSTTRHGGAWVERGIAPTHSRPRQKWWWVVSVTPRRALAPEKGPPVPIVQDAGWAPELVWTQTLEEKSFRLCRGSNLDRSVVQPVVRHCTDWATPAPWMNEGMINL
jgi:hypothetical protein